MSRRTSRVRIPGAKEIQKRRAARSVSRSKHAHVQFAGNFRRIQNAAQSGGRISRYRSRRQVQAASTDELAKAYGENRDAFQLPINASFGRGQKLDAAVFRQRVIDAETQVERQHAARRAGYAMTERAAGRALGTAFTISPLRNSWRTYLLAPRGAALVYYGQEIGMQNRDPRTLEEVQDVNGKRGWPNNKGRDGERTPMQWTAGQERRLQYRREDMVAHRRWVSGAQCRDGS